MYEPRLMRDERPITGKVFVAMPFGKKELSNGSVFDFDELFENVYRPTISEAGMEAIRADEIFGPGTLLEPVWRAIQQAEVVAVDFTGWNPNVAMEFAFAYLIGKRMVYLSQRPEDIPTDVRGRLRYITYSSHFNDIARMRRELTATIEAIRLEPTIEMTLIPMPAGGTVPVPAKIISLTREFAVVKTDDGRRGVLGCEDVDYARNITDMTRRFTLGEQLDGAFEVDTSGGMKYTLLAGQANPWNLIAKAFPPGQTFSSTVRAVAEAGVFVQVEGTVNGLIPRSMLPARVDICAGMSVEVRVVQLDVTRRRVTLSLVRADRLVHQASAAPASMASAEETVLRPGDRLEGEVIKAKPEGAGGYILLKVTGRQRPAFLHCTQMSQLLRDDLNRGEVEVGELLDLEVTGVDPAKGRVLVKDLPEEAADNGEDLRVPPGKEASMAA
jgi:ribosomal protein S1